MRYLQGMWLFGLGLVLGVEDWILFGISLCILSLLLLIERHEGPLV